MEELASPYGGREVAGWSAPAHAQLEADFQVQVNLGLPHCQM